MATPRAFPLRLRDSIDSAERILGPRLVDGQDCYPAERLGDKPPPGRDWRHAKFGFMRPVNRGIIRAASVDIFVRYRPSSGTIWCITLSDACRDHRVCLGDVDTQRGLSGALGSLGAPTAKHPARFAKLIDVYWWLRDDASYQIDVFRQDYEDLAYSWKAGDIQHLRVFAAELAPPWEEGLTHRA